jgi:hypothetical protein
MKKNGKKASSQEKRNAVNGCAKTAKTRKTKVMADEEAQNAPNGAAEAPDATNDASAAPGRDVGAPGAPEGQPVADGGKPMSLLDAAAHILSLGTGDPMRCKDIVALAVQRGLWTPRTGKTPASTLYAAILREVTAKGEASRFVKTERGKFALKDSEHMREATAKNSQV